MLQKKIYSNKAQLGKILILIAIVLGVIASFMPWHGVEELTTTNYSVLTDWDETYDLNLTVNGFGQGVYFIILIYFYFLFKVSKNKIINKIDIIFGIAPLIFGVVRYFVAPIFFLDQKGYYSFKNTEFGLYIFIISTIFLFVGIILYSKKYYKSQVVFSQLGIKKKIFFVFVIVIFFIAITFYSWMAYNMFVGNQVHNFSWVFSLLFALVYGIISIFLVPVFSVIYPFMKIIKDKSINKKIALSFIIFNIFFYCIYYWLG